MILNEKPEVMRVFSSKSNPARKYSVSKDREGILHCDCPAWRFQKKASQFRECKHVKMYVEERATEVQQQKE